VEPLSLTLSPQEKEHSLSDDEGQAMSTHFFGIKDWTFSYSHSVGRNEFAGTGFRNPMDLALAPTQGQEDTVYVVNRSYENRPDGIHVTVCTLNEEYIREFGSHGEGWQLTVTLLLEDRVVE